jgi:hypothetical protein
MIGAVQAREGSVEESLRVLPSKSLLRAKARPRLRVVAAAVADLLLWWRRREQREGLIEEMSRRGTS